MIKNKSAQIDKIIITLPVWIFVILIIVLFSVLAAVFSINKPEFPSANSISKQKENPLLTTIKTENGKEILLLDAISVSWEGNLGRGVIAEAIKSFSKKINSCVIVFVDAWSTDDAIFTYKNGELSDNFLGLYENRELTNSFATEINGKTATIEYYSGGCL